MTKPRQDFPLEAHWAMETRALDQLIEFRRAALSMEPEALGQVRQALSMARKQDAGSDAGPGYEVVDGVAVIPFEGIVTKRGTCMGSMFGGDAVTSTTQQAVEAAVADPIVDSILLVIDSPGGTVSGTAALADAVHAANVAKPVTAYCSDMAASAAYWIGSQAGKMFANATAAIGSIGVYAAIPDVSRQYANAGVEMKIVKAGEGKGAGVRGTHITDGQLADMQREIDGIYLEFVASVARGRGISQDKALSLADGRVHTARAAADMGLIDGVMSLGEVLGNMKQKAALNVEWARPSATAQAASTFPAQPADDKRADGFAPALAQQEEIMSEPTPDFLKRLEQLEAKSKTDSDALASAQAEVTALKAKLDGTVGTVAAISTERGIEKLLTEARGENAAKEIRIGAKDDVTAGYVRLTYETKGEAAARELVAKLPLLGSSGSQMRGTAPKPAAAASGTAAPGTTVGLMAGIDAYSLEGDKELAAAARELSKSKGISVIQAARELTRATA